VDLLITVPDHWPIGHDRVRVLGNLWGKYSSHRLPLNDSNTEMLLQASLVTSTGL
jgi:hypothetical protein